MWIAGIFMMLWGLGIAALAAILVGISTRIVVVRTSQLAAVQDLLSAAKNRQLQADLKVKDLEIGNLKTRSDMADASIAAAKVEVARAGGAQQGVEIELSKQRARAADAERSLLELREKIGGRSISEAQRKKFLEVTAGARKGEVKISAISGDPESIAFAEELRCS